MLELIFPHFNERGSMCWLSPNTTPEKFHCAFIIKGINKNFEVVEQASTL